MLICNYYELLNVLTCGFFKINYNYENDIIYSQSSKQTQTKYIFDNKNNKCIDTYPKYIYESSYSSPEYLSPASGSETSWETVDYLNEYST